jgi:beta-glucanase (GH16 family)
MINQRAPNADAWTMVLRRIHALMLALVLLALAIGAAPSRAASGRRPARVTHRSTGVEHVKRNRKVRHTAGAPQRLGRQAAAAPGTPSGVPMPTGNLPGWHQVFADDFSGSTLDTSKWRLYWGQPGGDPGGWFDPSHVSVSNGELVITASRDPAHGGRWATGGVSSSPGLVQTYGKYLVGFRFDAGVGIAHALVLTPADGTWPPEVDFSEDNGSSHRATLATLHHRPRDRKISGEEAVDLRQWHTLGVEWTTGLLRYTLDGRTWFTTANPAVPRVPMALAIQTQAWPCADTWAVCPGRSTPRVVSLRVDWVVAYAPAAPR